MILREPIDMQIKRIMEMLRGEPADGLPYDWIVYHEDGPPTLREDVHPTRQQMDTWEIWREMWCRTCPAKDFVPNPKYDDVLPGW